MSAPRPNILLEHYLKQLKMPTMLREHAAVAARHMQQRERRLYHVSHAARRTGDS